MRHTNLENGQTPSSRRFAANTEAIDVRYVRITAHAERQAPFLRLDRNLYTAEKATQMAREAIPSSGGNGYINEYPAGRLLCDAKLDEIGTGTSQIRCMPIGHAPFQEAASCRS